MSVSLTNEYGYSILTPSSNYLDLYVAKHAYIVCQYVMYFLSLINRIIYLTQCIQFYYYVTLLIAVLHSKALILLFLPQPTMLLQSKHITK